MNNQIKIVFFVVLINPNLQSRNPGEGEKTRTEDLVMDWPVVTNFNSLRETEVMFSSFPPLFFINSRLYSEFVTAFGYINQTSQ